MRIKKEIKYFVIGIALITISIIYLQVSYNNAVNTCIKAGNEINYCKEGLK